MKRIVKHFKLIFFVLLLADFVFSFLQYYNTPLYGDLDGVLPNEDIQKILNDPLGFHAVFSGEKHINPNRYFSHLALMEYFQHVPFWLQRVTNPIASVYLASAIIKFLIQVLFVFGLSFFISEGKRIRINDFLLSTILISPLFQVYGYWSRLGIVDKSVVYTFFYALPLVLLLYYIVLLMNSFKRQRNFHPVIFVLLSLFAVVLPLSGPLVPGVVLTSSAAFALLFFVSKEIKTEILLKIPIQIKFLWIFINLWSLYSLFLGKYDSNYSTDLIPVWERYLRLPEGIWKQLFHSAGFPVLLALILLNLYQLKKNADMATCKKLFQQIKWIGLFALLYILLLPLGGYRPYRPRIIRYDTFMPVTIALIYFFGISTFTLVKWSLGKTKKIYLLMITIVLLFFTFADFEGLTENRCERNAFKKIASAKGPVVEIPENCNVLSWNPSNDYKDSEKRSELLYFWNITNERKLFYNKQY